MIFWAALTLPLQDCGVTFYSSTSSPRCLFLGFFLFVEGWLYLKSALPGTWSFFQTSGLQHVCFNPGLLRRMINTLSCVNHQIIVAAQPERSFIISPTDDLAFIISTTALLALWQTKGLKEEQTALSAVPQLVNSNRRDYVTQRNGCINRRVGLFFFCLKQLWFALIWQELCTSVRLCPSCLWARCLMWQRSSHTEPRWIEGVFRRNVASLGSPWTNRD